MNYKEEISRSIINFESIWEFQQLLSYWDLETKSITACGFVWWSPTGAQLISWLNFVILIRAWIADFFRLFFFLYLVVVDSLG